MRPFGGRAKQGMSEARTGQRAPIEAGHANIKVPLQVWWEFALNIEPQNVTRKQSRRQDVLDIPGLSQCDRKMQKMLAPACPFPFHAQDTHDPGNPAISVQVCERELFIFYQHGAASGCGDGRQLRVGSGPSGEAGQQPPGLCGDAQLGQERLPDGGSLQGIGRGECEASGVGCEHCHLVRGI